MSRLTEQELDLIAAAKERRIVHRAVVQGDVPV